MNYPRMTNDLSNLPDSPCVGICSTLFDPICRGCGRTDAEVSNWVFYSEDEKQVIWQRLLRAGWQPLMREKHNAR